MLKRLWHFILRQVGLVPARKIGGLIREVIKLEEEVEALKRELKESLEENKSLWFMLDESKSSSNISQNTIREFVEDVKESIVEEMLKDFDPIGEA